MALVQYPPPVDYAAQLNAFKDFLQHFKTFESASEAAATEAIEDLHIDGDATSDEYDFMDDVENENGQKGQEHIAGVENQSSSTCRSCRT